MMTRVLIVDDKEENLYYLRALLTGNGCAVESARHGAEALVKARQSLPDLIISDLLMPVMDGYTLLRLWKSDARLRQIPFIVYTATYTEPRDEQLALSLGADAFILKPAEPEDFLARIREVCQNTAAGHPTPAKFASGDERELLKVYSETLIRKLEEKTLQLEESNRALQADIAGRKETEKALVESEEKFSKIFQSSPMAMALSTLEEGRYLDANKEFLRIVQRSRNEVVGRTSLELGIWADAAQRATYIAKFQAEGLLRNVELNIRGRDGHITPVLWSVESVQIAGQSCLLGSLLDISERKLAEEESRWKTAFLEAQIDSSMDGILVVDAQGRKILQNQRMTDLWKIPPDIARDSNDARQIDFVAGRVKNSRQFVAKIAHLNSRPDEVSRDEIELVDGTILDRYSSPVRDKSGKYYGRIWTFRDITEQRRLESQYRQSQKMEAFGQLAGGVAHDFNNILAVIQMQAGLLKTEPNLSLEQLEFAGEIEKSAQRGANLTRQLLLFSRQQTMQPRDLKLRDVVENIAKMLTRALGEHIHFQFKFPEETIYLHADPGMIDQILLNLSVNARDAMPKGGQITIETEAVELDAAAAAQIPRARPGLFARLSVSDTGEGIPPEILPRIFEPFFTTKEVGKGTGLGLATVFGIVQQHKGWINVESEVGHGTTFRIYLPRLDRSFDTKFLRAAPGAIRGGKETLLVVEDEASLRDSVRIALGRLGYHVLEAANGNEALKVWHEHGSEVALLLTDLVMPGGLSGKDLAEQMLKENPKLKVIYSTGYSTMNASQDFPLEEGVNFLSKPFDSHKLAQTIRSRLDGD